MKKQIVFLIGIIISGPFFIFPSLDFNIGASPNYIWRGFDLNPKNELMIIPYANLAIGDTGLSIEATGNYAMDKQELRELDLTLMYTFKLTRGLRAKLGFTEYRFFNTPDPYLKSDSREGFISLGLPWIFLRPEVTAYYDFGVGDGLYLKFSVRHAINLLRFMRLELSSSLGYNAGQWLPHGAKTGFSDFNFTAMLPIKLGRIYIVPFSSYTAVLLDSISNSKYFWYGITFGY
ncbi:MAG: hypothetical protein ABFR36_09235 [Acidobacteriota bacterium]